MMIINYNKTIIIRIVAKLIDQWTVPAEFKFQ